MLPSRSPDGSSFHIVRVLIDYRPALRERTGVGEWVHCLITALAATDTRRAPIDLTVFSSSWKDRLLTSFAPGITVIDRRVPVSLLNYAWHRLEWPPIEILTGRSFDIVHSPHPLIIPSNGAAPVVTIHDLDFLDHPEHTTAEINRDYPRLVKTHVNRAAQVIVPSHHTANQVAGRLGVPVNAITICPNGAPAWTPRHKRKEQGHLLFVGTSIPRKNIPVLIDAYEQLLQKQPDAPPLVLAGPSASESIDWQSALQRPKLRNRVRCTGYLTKSELKRYYETACALLIPSLNEGFGIPALEAMTIGVPVVASDRGALPEVVGNAGLLVDPTDPSALAEAIDRVTRDQAFANVCVERGFQQASLYSWDASALALRQAYENALAVRQRQDS